jgi:hypothetical protein
MKSWHLISGTFVAAAALSLYNNDLKISYSAIAYLVIAVIFYLMNRKKK